MQKILVSLIAFSASLAFAQDATQKYPLPAYKPKPSVAVPVIVLAPTPTPVTAAPVAVAMPAPAQAVLIVPVNPIPLVAATPSLKLGTTFAMEPASTKPDPAAEPGTSSKKSSKKSKAAKLKAARKKQMELAAAGAAPVVELAGVAGSTVVIQAPSVTSTLAVVSVPQPNAISAPYRKIMLGMDAVWDNTGTPTSSTTALLTSNMKSMMAAGAAPRKIRITGSTDQQSSAREAMRSTKEQVARFANLLMDLGVPFESIEAYSKGNLMPQVDCTSVAKKTRQACHQSNRQIQLEFFN